MLTDVSVKIEDDIKTTENASMKSVERVHLKFLVVDHSKTQRGAWSSTIISLGHHTSEAMSGFEAVETIRKNMQEFKASTHLAMPFDAVLLRLSLRTFIQELRLMGFPGHIFAIVSHREKKVRSVVCAVEVVSL